MKKISITIPLIIFAWLSLTQLNAMIVIFDGTCSTGKSTLVTEVARLIDDAVMIRCDGVFINVFNRIVKEKSCNIVENPPKDLMSLYRIAPELDSTFLDNEVDKEMYQQIRYFAEKGVPVLNDTAWVNDQCLENCKRELAGYKTVRIFVHSSWDDLLTRVKKRNLDQYEINHRPITLPFQVLPVMYRPHNPDVDSHKPIVDTWDKNIIVNFMFKLLEEFERGKSSYNKFWIEDGQNFFNSLDSFYDHFHLKTNQPIAITPKYPCDLVVNTSTMTTEECARQIVAWLQESSI